MFSKEEVRRKEEKVLCPHALQLFHEVRNVENYNNDVLNSYDNNVVSIANDEIIGCQNVDDTNSFRLKKPIDTGGLPYTERKVW